MIGEKIRIRLERNNSNASELARYCEVSPQAAAQWINDLAEPRRHKKELIARFFGITTQELEYGPVLSLTPLPRKSRISLIASREAAELMIDAELGSTLKSFEYYEGMRDRIISNLSESQIEPPYAIGSCQADAYNAGCEHGQRLIGKIQAY
jgi:transcriptional regulator with XRE-family HTH domain